jgi:hypothetical protein
MMPKSYGRLSEVNSKDSYSRISMTRAIQWHSRRLHEPHDQDSWVFVPKLFQMSVPNEADLVLYRLKRSVNDCYQLYLIVAVGWVKDVRQQGIRP